MTSQDDTGNHRVPQFTQVSFFMPQRHQITSLLRCDRIKRSDPPLDFVEEGLVEPLNQCRASPPNGQNLQSEANLEDRNGCRPDGGARLFIQPIDYLLVRWKLLHPARERKDEIGK